MDARDALVEAFVQLMQRRLVHQYRCALACLTSPYSRSKGAYDLSRKTAELLRDIISQRRWATALYVYVWFCPVVVPDLRP